MYAWRKFTVKLACEFGKQVRTLGLVFNCEHRAGYCWFLRARAHRLRGHGTDAAHAFMHCKLTAELLSSQVHSNLTQKAVCDSLIISVPFSPLLCLPALHWTFRRILQRPTRLILEHAGVFGCCRA